MKLWLMSLVAVIAVTLSGTASAQLPSELLGGGSRSGPTHSEAFYKGREGFWVLMRNPQNDGLRCSVNFITANEVFSIHGPLDPDMAKKNQGAFWFGSKKIPKAGKPEQVQITVTSADSDQTLPAMHINIDGVGSQLIVIGNIKQSIKKDKRDNNEIGIQFRGAEVFHLKVIRLQEAYRTLERCMSAGKAK